MSNPDSFLNEVAEEVRKDQLMRQVRRYGWIVATVVLLIIAGASAWEWRKAQDRAAAEGFGDAIIDALETQSTATQRLKLTEIDADETRAVIRDLMHAGIVAADDSADAAALLRGLIDDPSVPSLYQDVARLRLVQLPDNPLRTDERLAILDPLIAGIGPFRLLALELRAMVYLERRETDLAVADLRATLNDAEATQNQQQRTQQLLVALGEDPETL